MNSFRGDCKSSKFIFLWKSGFYMFSRIYHLQMLSLAAQFKSGPKRKKNKQEQMSKRMICTKQRSQEEGSGKEEN